MKKLILLCTVLLLGACSQDSGTSPKKVTSQQAPPNTPNSGGEQSGGANTPNPSEEDTGKSDDAFWKSKKVSCSTSYDKMRYHLETSFRFHADKMIGILDVKSWDGNANPPASASYELSYNLKCEFQSSSDNEPLMIVCKRENSAQDREKVTLWRNSLDEIKASVYVALQWMNDKYCNIYEKD